mmetsp:Transcript_18582/g.32941  ORF Transcript_18582/g.32941 Transcript_18582/m.32941 type:complete len:204 (-) Transcript_18582:221-832(-)
MRPLEARSFTPPAHEAFPEPSFAGGRHFPLGFTSIAQVAFWPVSLLMRSMYFFTAASLTFLTRSASASRAITSTLGSLSLMRPWTMRSRSISWYLALSPVELSSAFTASALHFSRRSSRTFILRTRSSASARETRMRSFIEISFSFSLTSVWILFLAACTIIELSRLASDWVFNLISFTFSFASCLMKVHICAICPSSPDILP